MSDGAGEADVLDMVVPDVGGSHASVQAASVQHARDVSFGVLDAVQGSIDVCSVPAGQRTAAEWMALVAECSRAMTVLSAARDAAMVRLAAIDEVVDDDGVVSEQVNGLGTVAVDAGSMMAAAIGCSPGFGEELVDQAVTRVVRVPALHEAMLSGLLDDYSARCVAGELTDAPVDIARAVVDALAEDVGVRSGPVLRRRARELLFRLAPDLLRTRIAAARTKIGLRRWVGEPGTDSWGASLPSEQAATAWAAVDALARRYRAEDTYPTLEMARAYALLDLVHGSATVDTVLHLTVPAQAVDGEDGHYGDDAAPTPRASQPRPAPDCSAYERSSTHAPTGGTTAGTRADIAPFVAVAGAQGGALSWMPVSATPASALSPSRAAGRCTPPLRFCHPLTGALIDPLDSLATDAYAPGERLKRLIRVRDGRCRFPGCTVPARSCDIDHVQAWPRGPTAAANLMCLCRRHHRVKQRMRWRVRIDPAGVVRWTDPRGAQHVTEPVDHLGVREVRSTRLSGADVRAAGSASTHRSATADWSTGATGSTSDDFPRTDAKVHEPRPGLVSVTEAVVGVRAEHRLAAVDRELAAAARNLRAARRAGARGPAVSEAHSGRCDVDETPSRRRRPRCGYADLFPLFPGEGALVELGDELMAHHEDRTRIVPGDDSPPF